MAGRFVQVRYPWSAVLEVGAPEPARFLAGVVSQALRYGLPATRRPSFPWTVAGRAGVPEGPAAAALRRLPTHARPDLDRLVEATREGWPALGARARALPADAPDLSALAMERSAGTTVFLFGGSPRPLLVLKRGGESVEREADSLREADSADVAPRLLGEVEGARVQEGLAGAPLEVEPLGPRRAARLKWSPALATVAAALRRLGTVTAKEGPPKELDRAIQEALAYPGLDRASRRTLQAAWRHVRSTRRCVLRHRDTSPQNCLMHDSRFAGVIDWELAVPRGAPGYDVLNLALSYLECGVGLTRWTDARIVKTFEAAWHESPFWRGARAAARAAALSAGAEEADLWPLEVCFFGSRVGDRIVRPGWHPYGPQTAARELHVLCGG